MDLFTDKFVAIPIPVHIMTTVPDYESSMYS
jgi:hypothetical protein